MISGHSDDDGVFDSSNRLQAHTFRLILYTRATAPRRLISSCPQYTYRTVWQFFSTRIQWQNAKNVRSQCHRFAQTGYTMGTSPFRVFSCRGPVLKFFWKKIEIFSNLSNSEKPRSRCRTRDRVLGVYTSEFHTKKSVLFCVWLYSLQIVFVLRGVTSPLKRLRRSRLSQQYDNDFSNDNDTFYLNFNA